ncbi:MAG: lysophospholipid acyltransferase family protein [Acidobacteriaceae bacterium]
MFAAIVLLSTWTVLGLPGALIAFPWTLLTGNIAFLYRTGMFIVRTGLRAAAIRIEFCQQVPLDPTQHYLFLANHISNLDPPILIPLLPGRISVFLKRSLMKIPILGYAMKVASFIPVDRDGRTESAIESMYAATSVLQSGVHILSFVEGTRSRDGRLQPFKKGPFYLAMHTGAPVVPVSISGTDKMMRKGSLRIFPGTARVILHAPLDPHAYATREELMDAVRTSIASGLPNWMRS